MSTPVAPSLFAVLKLLDESAQVGYADQTAAAAVADRKEVRRLAAPQAASVTHLATRNVDL